MKKITSLVLFLLFAGMQAIWGEEEIQEFAIGRLTYGILGDNTVYVRSTNPKIWDDETIIPETVTFEDKVYTVTTIKERGFYGFGSQAVTVRLPGSIVTIEDQAFAFSSASHIYMEEGVVEIGEAAFRRCELASLQLPNSLKSIGSHAFIDCDYLTSIEIPANVNSIGTNIIMRSPGIRQVTLSPENVYFTIEDEVLFDKDMTRLLIYPAAKTTEHYVLSASVTHIDPYAFFNCSFLENIDLPANLTYIGESAFQGCKNLLTMELPAKITSIENKTFYSCNNLLSVKFSDNLEKIGPYAFYYCEHLNGVEFPASLREIGYYAFKGTGLSEIEIPERVTFLDISVFASTELVSVKLPETLKVIGASAFAFCEKLMAIDIPAGVDYVGTNVFRSCASLKRIYCRAMEAPEIEKNTFAFIENAVLHIYPGATGYTADKGWPVNVVEDLDTSLKQEFVLPPFAFYVSDGKLYIESDWQETIPIYSIDGIYHTIDLQEGLNEIILPKGIYIVGGQKIIIDRN